MIFNSSNIKNMQHYVCMAKEAVHVFQDADQLLEKRVRSRFSHRKLLFLPPSREDTERLLLMFFYISVWSICRYTIQRQFVLSFFNLLCRLLDHILYLPKDSGLPSKYITEYNSRVQVSFLSISFGHLVIFV